MPKSKQRVFDNKSLKIIRFLKYLKLNYGCLTKNGKWKNGIRWILTREPAASVSISKK